METNFSKTLERVIAEPLVEYLEENNLLNADQFGFRKNRSTTGKLLASIDRITIQLAKNQPFDTVLLDLSKAFDKLSIAKIVEAAINIGIRGKLLLWLIAYLSGRTAKIRIGETMSRPINAGSGVPQGSILGPILFLIAINGLPQNCPERELLLSFADDTEVGGVATNYEGIQHTLDSIYHHCTYLKLEMNADKCEIMHRGPNNALHDYVIGDTTLRKTNSARDLGIIRTTDNKSNDHIRVIARKANNFFRFFLASFVSRSASTVLSIYKTFIRSILDYSSPCWSPHHATQIALLENLQKRVIAVIDDIDQDQPYRAKLKQLKLYSLQRRRDRYDLCYLYKHLSTDLPHLSIELSRENEIPRNCRHKRHLRDSAPLLPYERMKTVREESFVPRTIKSWNLLPPHIAEAPSFPAFKSRLDKLLATIDDVPLPEPGPLHITLLEQCKANRLHVRLVDYWRRRPSEPETPQPASSNRLNGLLS